MLIYWHFFFFFNTGCKDSNPVSGNQPAILVGTWDETGYDRRTILSLDGDFRHISVVNGVPQAEEGSGTWEATDDSLTLHLTDGQFRWLASTNVADISFTFMYSISDSSLALTFTIIGATTVAHYKRIE